MPKGAIIIFDEINDHGLPAKLWLEETMGIRNLRIERFSFDTKNLCGPLTIFLRIVCKDFRLASKIYDRDLIGFLRLHSDVDKEFSAN